MPLSFQASSVKPAIGAGLRHALQRDYKGGGAQRQLLGGGQLPNAAERVGHNFRCGGEGGGSEGCKHRGLEKECHRNQEDKPPMGGSPNRSSGLHGGGKAGTKPGPASRRLLPRSTRRPFHSFRLPSLAYPPAHYTRHRRGSTNPLTPVQLRVDFLLGPAIVLQVLHPLKVGDRHAAAVAVDVCGEGWVGKGRWKWVGGQGCVGESLGEQILHPHQHTSARVPWVSTSCTPTNTRRGCRHPSAADDCRPAAPAAAVDTHQAAPGCRGGAGRRHPLE